MRPQPTATEVQVESEVIEGMGSDPDEDSRALIVVGETLSVRRGAMILDPFAIQSIRPGGHVDLGELDREGGYLRNPINSSNLINPTNPINFSMKI